ncbi:MAG: FtsH protease activity modulator HflK [Chthoniobacteraceae bacterium]
MKNVTPPQIDLSKFNPRWILRGALVILVVWALISCYSTVPADSKGVLVRLGQYHSTVPPGLCFKLPLGIDQLILVAVERQQKLEFGFGTRGGSNESQYNASPDEQEAEQSMVTGDLNMANVEWVVQYRIQDPKDWLFHVENPGETLRAATESAMREVIGDRTVDEVLTIGRQDIENQCLLRLKELAELYRLGVAIMQVQLKNVHPPTPVQASFNEVNQAQQEKEQQINLANGEYNKAVPRAAGEAEQRLSEAEGYALKRVNEAEGDAGRFEALLTEYLKAREITRQRLYFETMKDVLPAISRKIIIDDQGNSVLPLLNLEHPGLERPGTPVNTP